MAIVSAAPKRATLDARGLLCPLPVIRTQDRAATLAPGDLLTVLASDPGAAHDIPAWCRMYGHRVVEVREEPGELTIIVEIGPEMR